MKDANSTKHLSTTHLQRLVKKASETASFTVRKAPQDLAKTIVTPYPEHVSDVDDMGKTTIRPQTKKRAANATVLAKGKRGIPRVRENNLAPPAAQSPRQPTSVASTSEMSADPKATHLVNVQPPLVATTCRPMPPPPIHNFAASFAKPPPAPPAPPLPPPAPKPPRGKRTQGGIPKRTQILAAGASFLVLAILWLTVGASASTPSAQSTIAASSIPTPPEPTPPNTSTSIPTKENVEAPPSDSDTDTIAKTSEAQAARLLLAGKRREALNHYQALARQEEVNPGVVAMVEVLTQEVEQ